MEKPQNISNKEKDFARLKQILTIIGESLKDYFKQFIGRETKTSPQQITIIDVKSQDFYSSRSKTHFVTYTLKSEIGSHVVNLIVKFSKDEESFIKEISNHELLSSTLRNYPCIIVPPIIYKSTKNKCIIYEAGSSMAVDTIITEDDEIKLAAKTLALIHGTGEKEIDVEPYKTIVLFLVSLLNNEDLEKELINLLVPYLSLLQKSKGAAIIHGDFHKANLKIVLDTTMEPSDLASRDCENARVYVFNSEFIEANKDRCEDIGAFFAAEAMQEYKTNNSFISTKNKVMKFIYEYDKTLHEIGSTKDLQSLYPEGYTIDFHVSTYILYDIVDMMKNEGLPIDSPKVQANIELLRALLRERPFS